MKTKTLALIIIITISIGSGVSTEETAAYRYKSMKWNIAPGTPVDDMIIPEFFFNGDAQTYYQYNATHIGDFDLPDHVLDIDLYMDIYNSSKDNIILDFYLIFSSAMSYLDERTKSYLIYYNTSMVNFDIEKVEFDNVLYNLGNTTFYTYEYYWVNGDLKYNLTEFITIPIIELNDTSNFKLHFSVNYIPAIFEPTSNPIIEKIEKHALLISITLLIIIIIILNSNKKKTLSCQTLTCGLINTDPTAEWCAECGAKLV